MAVPLPGIVRMGLVRRLPSLTPDEFGDHWRGPHGTLASVMPGLIRYQQNHVVESFGVEGLRDEWQLDGLSELWFDSLGTMEKAIASASYSNLAQDTPKVMTLPGVIAGTQEAAAEDRGRDAPLHKAMVVVGRRKDLSLDEFLGSWRQVSLDIVASGGAASLVNTIVTHREGEPGQRVPYESLPIDVVMEVWFEDLDQLRHCLGATLDGALAGVVANASLYRVETHVIVP